jgi:hypothetical protein
VVNKNAPRPCVVLKAAARLSEIFCAATTGHLVSLPHQLRVQIKIRQWRTTLLGGEARRSLNIIAMIALQGQYRCEMMCSGTNYPLGSSCPCSTTSDLADRAGARFGASACAGCASSEAGQSVPPTNPDVCEIADARDSSRPETRLYRNTW